jgi:uncharacterized membrane protein YdjX (TVP38/TMEM64 family)
MKGRIIAKTTRVFKHNGGRGMPLASWWAKHWQKAGAAFIWASIIGGLLLFMRTHQLTPSALFLAGLAWVQANPLAPLVYIVLYALRPLTLFSSVILTLAGGFLFGPVWGILYTVIGANLSATIAFFVGRYFGQGFLDDETANGRMQRYARRMRENSFETVLIMRFIFLPYDLVNYLSGFLRVGYGSFLLATVIGSIPGTVAFVWMGASLSTTEMVNMVQTGKLPTLDWRLLIVSAIMFVVSIALSQYLKRRESAATAVASW